MNQFRTEIIIQLGLGLLQGLTEIFPISSSGHLALVKEFFNLNEFSIGLAAFLHLGTFFAILVWIRKDVISLWNSFKVSIPKVFLYLFNHGENPFKEQASSKIPYYMFISIAATALVGILLKGPANHVFQERTYVMLLLTINGLIILSAGWFSAGDRTMAEIGVLDYLIIGALQGIAVIPGISRLGLTLCGSLFRKMSWSEALKLSFLLSLPAALGFAVEFSELTSHGMILGVDALALAMGVLGATVGGFIAIWFLMLPKMLERKTLIFFGIYCILVGIFSYTYLSNLP